MRAAFDLSAGGAAMARHWAGIDASDEADDGGPQAHRYRSIFISDLHLGTPGCQAAALQSFLKHNPSDNLYLCLLYTSRCV